MTDYQGYEAIEFEWLGDVLRVTLANPRNELNAVDGAMHAELRRLFEELKNEDDARAVILTGSGRAFSAGGDFEWMANWRPEDLSALRREGKQIIWNLLDVEGPIVAGDGGAVAWPLAVGPAVAKRYLLTGDALTAADAERLGLITHAVPAGELQDEALAFARRLAQGAPLAVRYTKLAVNQLVKQSLTTAFDYSTALEVLTFASADHREALRAMSSKQRAEFAGV